MKVVVLGTRGVAGVQGGVETHCDHIYPEMVKKGADITIFTRKPYLDGLKEYKGMKLKPLPCPKSKYLEAFSHTFLAVLEAKKLKPDIVHIHAIGPSLCVPLARALGLKVVMTHHGPDYMRKKWGALAKTVLRMGEFFGAKFSNKIIVISNPIFCHIKKKFKRTPVIIPNGVVVQAAVETEDVLSRYGLVKEKYVLTVGRLVPEKGFHDLIDAFEGIKNYKLVIAGDADHKDKYSRELKNKASRNPNIVMTGFLRGIPLKELFSHAKLFVLPSYHEGLPIVLLEALSYGLPYIVSDIEPHKDMGISEEHFFQAGSINGLRQKIECFIGKEISDKERKNQIDMVKEKYNWAKIAEDTISVYKTVLNKN